MPVDSYKTIAASSQGEFRDRASKFIAYAFPLRSEEEWSALLNQVKKEHPKARHHCYAYRFGPEGSAWRANDDGEPSGTAGRPILGQLISFDLTCVMVIVVRYFGGTLLGTSGLTNAYRESTRTALEQAQIVEKTLMNHYRIRFDYALMGTLMDALKKVHAQVLQRDFSTEPELTIALRQSEAEAELIRIKALLAKISLEEAANLDKIDGLRITAI